MQPGKNFLDGTLVSPIEAADQHLARIPYQPTSQHYINHNIVDHSQPHIAVLSQYSLIPLVSDTEDFLKSIQQPLCTVQSFYNEMGTPVIPAQKNVTVDAIPSSDYVS